MSELGPVYDDFGVPTNEPLDLRCRHDSVMTWGDHEGHRMWSCSDCNIRMYPACRVCVDVGHRNEVHVPAMTATWKRRARILRHYLDVLRREGYQKQVRIEALEDNRRRAPYPAYVDGQRSERARIRAAVEGLRDQIGYYTCWDNHDGPGGTHRDGSRCEGKKHVYVDRAAVLAAIDGGEE